jgi:tetratricopeptide (TPR) repeat protein
MGRSYEQENMFGKVDAVFQRIRAVAPKDPAVLALVGHEYAISGRRSEALKIVSELHQISTERYVAPLWFAMLYAGLNDKDQALAWLEKAYDEDSDYLIYLPTEPAADMLRSDPRFSAFLKKLGLPGANISATISGK